MICVARVFYYTDWGGNDELLGSLTISSNTDLGGKDVLLGSLTISSNTDWGCDDVCC